MDYPSLVLAISPQSDRMHVGPPADLLSHLTEEMPDSRSGQVPIAWEFHASDGRRLVRDSSGALVPDTAAAAPTRASRQVLAARVDLVLAHAQQRLDAKLEELAGVRPPGPDDRVRMVRVQGEFQDVLTMLYAVGQGLDPNPGQPHPGSWWHNFWAH